MNRDCPVCGHDPPTAGSSCDGCGYPVALWSDVAAALQEMPELPPSSAAPRGGAATKRPTVAVARTRDQTGDACARSARELAGHLALLAQLGGPAEGFSGDLRQAALVQAEGRGGEALDLLTAAEARAASDVSELFDRRATELEHRAEALDRQGVKTELGDPMGRLRTAIAESRLGDAAKVIVETDRSLGSLEQDLRALKGLLDQIRQLRQGILETGRTATEVDDDLAQIEALLARPRVDAEVLDSAAQVAARALMLLHESIPGILEADLDRHASTLSVYSTDHHAARKAKTLHAEVARQLRRGRLVEATQRLAELRTALRELEASPPAPTVSALAAETEPVSPPETVEEADALPRLLQKARSLATRVRALTPDSEIAYEAASEIRRATELLKARKLEEADVALTRLMRTLDSEPATGG